MRAELRNQVRAERLDEVASEPNLSGWAPNRIGPAGRAMRQRVGSARSLTKASIPATAELPGSSGIDLRSLADRATR